MSLPHDDLYGRYPASNQSTQDQAAQNAYQAAQNNAYRGQLQKSAVAPEDRIAAAFLEDLGVVINPQALRIFIRTRWELLSDAAHQIHRGK